MSTSLLRRTLQRLSSTKNKIDVCISSAAPDGTVKTDAVFNATVQLKEKGIKIKYITEITKGIFPTVRDSWRLVKFGIWMESREIIR
jgi:hypothetical protein